MLISGDDWDSPENVLHAARKLNIKLPRSKSETTRKIEAAIQDVTAACASDGIKRSLADVTQILIEDCGVKKETGKRKAEEREADSKPSASLVLYETWDASKKAERKPLAAKLVDVAKSRGVKMPEEQEKALKGAFMALMGVKGEGGKFAVREAVEALEQKYGKDPSWVDPDGKATKKKKPSKAKPCTCPENAGLAEAFDELAGFKFKEGSRAGLVYKKVVSSIKDLPEPLTEPPKKGRIKGIGAGSIMKIEQFLATGTMEELEEYRANETA